MSLAQGSPWFRLAAAALRTFTRDTWLGRCGGAWNRIYSVKYVVGPRDWVLSRLWSALEPEGHDNHRYGAQAERESVGRNSEEMGPNELSLTGDPFPQLLDGSHPLDLSVGAAGPSS